MIELLRETHSLCRDLLESRGGRYRDLKALLNDARSERTRFDISANLSDFFHLNEMAFVVLAVLDPHHSAFDAALEASRRLDGARYKNSSGLFPLEELEELLTTAAGYLEAIERSIDAGRLKVDDSGFISGSALAEWLSERGVTDLPPVLMRLLPTSTGDDWVRIIASHPTNMLRYAASAIQHFGTPGDQSRFPNSDVVVAWLMKTYSLSERSAKAIDLVIRPESRKRSGVKKGAT